MSRYFEFAVASNFSFLRGASHAEELMLQAAHIGLDGIGLCDRNSVAGVVRAHLIKREQKLALGYHPGARLVFADGTPDILAYPRDRAAWGRLCRLLTCGNLRAEKGDCILLLDDLLEHIDGLELIVMEGATRDVEAPPPEKWKTTPATEVVLPQAAAGKAKLRLIAGSKKPSLLAVLQNAAPGRVRLAATMLYRGNDRARLARRAESARAAGVPLIAVNDVFYHHPDRRELQDVLTCIREHLTIDRAGRRLAVNAERFLKAPAEMARLFHAAPDAIEETLALDAALTFSLDELRYEYPDEMRAGFATPQEALVHFAWEGAATRYPGGIPDKVRQNLEHELALIAELQYAPYFLTVHDIVRYARSEKILCQGRGSAANSSVCFCLGVTEVDPSLHDLLFERFVSADRNEPPDIDVDFEHERREEVIQYIYRRYGRERTGIAATVISYRGRSAIREVGKVFGLSEDTIGALSSSIWGMGGGAVRTDELVRAGIDVNSPRMQKMRALVEEIQSFPRHLSQHVGGFVITRNRLDEAIPIANAAMEERTFVEWDKDDLDALGMLKVDVLGLGMLTCIRKAFEFVEKHYGEKLTLATIPKEEEAVYRMLQRANSLGVFQVESRAQMSMLPRLKPENFYDLVIEVAIVRPGPIQGDMVHPYLRRRQELEPVSYPSPELEAVLGKTLGVPLFQEQAMKIAIVAGGFTPGEADKLRRAMATFKRTGTIGTFKTKMIEGMVARDYPREFAERCFSQIEGFGEYGFPESHAASFALLVYASAWLKCRYPDVFAAALLNAQPMGFYAPAQIVRDVREHGVEVRPVDVNHSDWDATLEPGPDGRADRVCTRSTATWRATSAPRTRCGWASQDQGVVGGPRQADRDEPRRTAIRPCAISGCAPACRPASSSGWPTPMPSARSALTPAAGAVGRRRPYRARSLASRTSVPRHRAARRRRCLRLARPQRRRRCGRRRRSAASATRTTICRCFASRRHRRRRNFSRARARCPAPAHAAGRGGRERLSFPRTVAAAASRILPARRPRPARHHPQRGAARVEVGRARYRLRPRHHSPAAGLGQWRHLHDHRGRDGRRQHHRLVEDVRALSPDHPGRALCRRERGGAAGIRRHPRGRGKARRSHGAAGALDRGCPAARFARTRRRGQAPARRGHRQPRPRSPQSAAHRSAHGVAGSAGERPRRAGTRLGACALAPRRHEDRASLT